MKEHKYYGISTGNGNDGVSQMFPDFIVKTNQPWLLAELAALSYFKDGEGKAWAKENMEIDGEEDYTISVVFMESPEQQEECNRSEEEEEGSTESWDMTDWFIVEVFPVGETEQKNGKWTTVYNSLSEAFDASDILDVCDGDFPMITTWKRGDENYTGEATVYCNPVEGIGFGKGFVRVN